MKHIEFVGGPLDGIKLPHTHYFNEGDIEAVNTLPFASEDSQWSAESVYVVRCNKLVYDPEGTIKRREITDADPSQLE